MRDRSDRSSRNAEVAKRRENFFEVNQIWRPHGLREERGEVPEHRDVSAGIGTAMPKSKGLLRGPAAAQYVGKHQPRKG
jgi:hypothetical protein